jgi:ABC-type multidrug transport system fused ATPase/permease subunit
MTEPPKDEPTDNSTTSGFKSSAVRLLSLIYPDRKAFAFAVGAMTVSSVCNLLLPTVLGLAVDRVSGSTSTSTAPSTSSVMNTVRNLQDAHFFAGCLGIFGLGSLASWYRTYTVGAITENIAMRLRCQIYASVLHRDSFLRNNSTVSPSATQETDTETQEIKDSSSSSQQTLETLQCFDVVQALSVESDVLAGAATKILTNLLRGCNSAFGGSMLLLTISPKLTVASLAVVPLIGITAMVTRLRTRQQSKEVSKQLSIVNGRADERLKHLHTVKIFAREQYELQEYTTLVEHIKQLRQNVAFSDGIFMGALNMSVTSSLLGVLCFGGVLVKRGELTGGKLTAFMSYTMMMGMGSSMLAGIKVKTVSAVAAAENVFRILDQTDRGGGGEDEVDGESNDEGCSAVFTGDILFDRVHFGYANCGVGSDGQRASKVLNGLQCKVAAGSQTAFVGPSGAGKSTIIALLLRLYECNSGSITIGGVNIQDIPREVLLKNIGVVNQRPVLWNVSIRENIRYGRLDATDDEIDSVVEKAHMHEFIKDMPLGLETVVGEEGSVRLSGGQLARIAIARAMIKNPPILILDEATSSLDQISEQIVRKAIDELMVGRTTIVVGHSIDAIKSSTTVCVVENGQICEQGEMMVLLQQNQESKLMKYVHSSTRVPGSSCSSE